MKLRHLEMKLERLSVIEKPDVSLEQYVTPATVAARMLFSAFMNGDIEGRRVCDLGCGAGVLSCGAALLGAGHVTGIDIDENAVLTAGRNAGLFGVDVEFIVGDISVTELPKCDTVVMNPPFGAQKKYADRPFIDAALSCAEVVYGIFNAGSLAFVEAYTKDRAHVEWVVTCEFPVKHTFSHHTKECVDINVEIICLSVNK